MVDRWKDTRMDGMCMTKILMTRKRWTGRKTEAGKTGYTEGWMHGWINVKMDIEKDRRMDKSMDGRIGAEGQMERWIDGRMDIWKNGLID